MSDVTRSYDFGEASQSRRSSRLESSDSSVQDTDFNSLSLSGFSLTPLSTPPTSQSSLSNKPATDVVKVIDLVGALILSFTKGNKLFKLSYSKIEVVRDRSFDLRCIELSEPGQVSTLIHTFNEVSKPIPHLEIPSTTAEDSLRVSFLEEQTVQLSQTIFPTQPRYIFESPVDCKNFQEAVLDCTLLFAAGAAEIVSKGRGEEAISQNLRLSRTRTGTILLLYFANAQRREQKGYVGFPVDVIDTALPPRKSGKPVTLRLSNTSEIATVLRGLEIVFLDHSRALQFCAILRAAGVSVTSR